MSIELSTALKVKDNNGNFVNGIAIPSKPQNLITPTATYSAGYYEYKYGQQPKITTSSNPHWHFDELIEIEPNNVYTIEVPTGTYLGIALFDNDMLLRGVRNAAECNSLNFICPPNIKYIGFVVKYPVNNAVEYYMRNIKLYKNNNLGYKEIDITDALNDINNWEHKNIAYSSGKNFETNKTNGTNAAYIRYNNLISINSNEPILVYNLSSYTTMNIQVYDSNDLARLDWKSTSNELTHMNFYYDKIAFSPNAGSSANIEDVLNNYKQWLHLYQIYEKK